MELALKQVPARSKEPEKIDPNRKTLSANSLQNALICLRVVLQSAVEDGLLSVNPASKMGLIQDGASLAYVKERLGHSTIAVTVDL